MDMNSPLIRNILELTLLFPAVMYAFLPTGNHLRFSIRSVVLGSMALILLAIFGGAELCVRLQIPSYFVLFISMVLFFPLYYFVLDLALGKAMFCVLTSAMICTYCRLYMSIIMAPWELDQELTYAPLSSLVCLALALFLGYFFFITMTVKLPYLFESEWIAPMWKWFLIFPGVMTFLFWWMIPMDLSIVMHGRIRLVCLVALPAVILVFWILCHLLWWNTREITRSHRLQQENNLLLLESKRYDDMRLYIDEARAIRHDFRQHLRVIGELARAGRTEAILEYLEDAEATVSNSTRYCQNIAVDAIAAHYAHIARENNVTIHWTLELPGELPLSEADLCAILGNLLENAMNAVTLLPEEQRQITVIARMLSDAMLGLSVENPYTGRIRFNRDGLPLSSKIGHGVGLPSVAATVRRHRGKLEIKAANGVYSAEVLMYAD